MFRITDGKGFHIKFANGFTVSVQFGPGNYCDNHDKWPSFDTQDKDFGRHSSSTAECAVWGEDGEMIQYGDWDNTFGGYMTPAQVLELMNWAASQ